MNDRSWLGSLLRSGTYARYSGCLAWASTPGFGRRRLHARFCFALASSLDFLQGTSEKIHLQCLLSQHSLQFADFFTEPSLWRVDSWAFIVFSDFQPFTPLVQQRSMNP